MGSFTYYVSTMKGEGGSKISQNMLIYSTKTAYERGEVGFKILKKYAYAKCESSLKIFFIICKWLLELESGKTIALHCSDVSAAFDRVSKVLLASKLCPTAPVRFDHRPTSSRAQLQQ